MYTIRKEFHFSASHNLLKLPEEHPCARVHGHNYIITVELASTKLSATGFVKDYRELDMIKKDIDLNFDHRHLNAVLPSNLNPTAENIAKFLYIRWHISLPQIVAIEVSETPKTTARYTPEHD